MERNVKHGFTLVEVVISMVTMSIVALLLATVITEAFRQQRLSFTNDEAYAIAREKLAELQVEGIAITNGADTKTTKNGTYARIWEVSTAANSAVRAVITVTWANGSANRSISVTGYVSGSICPETGTTTTPTNLGPSAFSLLPGLPALTEVGMFTITDPDIAAVGDMITYEMATGGTHNSKFIIQGNRLYTAVPNLTAGTYTISVMATDCSGGSVSRNDIQVTVTTVPTFIVTYDGNTNTGGTPPAAVTYNENDQVTVEVEGSLAKTNHLFNGWNTAANGSGTSYTAGATFVAQNVALYAQWVPAVNNKVVTFDAQSGTVSPSEVLVELNKSISQNNSPNNVLPTPTRSSYRFDGWFNGTNGSGGEFLTTTTITDNKTVYAKWTQLYSVTYSGNGNTGGTVPEDNTKYPAGTAVTVRSNTGTLVKSGYSFSTWNTQANGAGTDRAVGTSFTMGSVDVTLYAKWAIPSWTVTFDAQGGTPVAAKTVSSGGTVGTLPTAPTNSGNTFGGWYTGTNGSGSSFTASTVVTSNITVYAKWTAVFNPCSGVPNFVVWNGSNQTMYNGGWGGYTPSKVVYNNKLYQGGDPYYQWYNHNGLPGALANWTFVADCP